MRHAYSACQRLYPSPPFHLLLLPGNPIKSCPCVPPSAPEPTPSEHNKCFAADLNNKIDKVQTLVFLLRWQKGQLKGENAELNVFSSNARTMEGGGRGHARWKRERERAVSHSPLIVVVYDGERVAVSHSLSLFSHKHTHTKHTLCCLKKCVN
jgi:hypothetical protein